MKSEIALDQSEEGFSVCVPGLPGCWSQKAREQEVLDVGKRNVARKVRFRAENVVREASEQVDRLGHSASELARAWGQTRGHVSWAVRPGAEEVRALESGIDECWRSES